MVESISNPEKKAENLIKSHKFVDMHAYARNAKKVLTYAESEIFIYPTFFHNFAFNYFFLATAYLDFVGKAHLDS
jgi:hypothetical protein